jgi:hypothetical protein
MTTMYNEGRVRVIEQLEKEEFHILNICDVMDWIYSTFRPNGQRWDMSWEEESKYLKQFCDNFQLYLYEKPNEEFFEWEGAEEARLGGYRGVILSNLS